VNFAAIEKTSKSAW